MSGDLTESPDDLIITKSTENIIITNKGEERRILWQNALMVDEGGNIEGMISSGIDITKEYLFRRRA